MGQMREIFDEIWWNDYEDSYLVPVKSISDDNVRRLKEVGIDLHLYPLVEYLVATSENYPTNSLTTPISSV